MAVSCNYLLFTWVFSYFCLDRNFLPCFTLISYLLGPLKSLMGLSDCLIYRLVVRCFLDYSICAPFYFYHKFMLSASEPVF
ncbi:hypothetical protein AtNW77_Chr1g0000361 [Arabidopsis thaliana]